MFTTLFLNTKYIVFTDHKILAINYKIILQKKFMIKFMIKYSILLFKVLVLRTSF